MVEDGLYAVMAGMQNYTMQLCMHLLEEHPFLGPCLNVRIGSSCEAEMVHQS